MILSLDFFKLSPAVQSQIARNFKLTRPGEPTLYPEGVVRARSRGKTKSVQPRR